MSFVSFDSDLSHTRLLGLQLRPHQHPDGPETTRAALAAFEGGGVKEAKIKQGNKGDKEVCLSAGFGSQQLMGCVEIGGPASKITERAWTESPRCDKAQRRGR